MLKKLQLFLVALTTIALFTSCKDNNQPSTPSEYKINYSANILSTQNEPIINAVVNISTKDNSKVIASDTSDENGYVSFENITSNTEELNLVINHPLYNTLVLKYGNLEKKETDKVFLEDNTDCCGVSELTITDEDGNPLKDVLVQVRQSRKELKKSKSDDNGKVKLTGLCLEEYNLRLSIDGYKVIEKNISIENCEKSLELSFTMIKTDTESDTCCKAVITFKPKDKDGNVLNGTKVYLYKDGKVIEDPVVKDGQAVIDGLCEGKYNIVYKREGYKDKEGQVEISCNVHKTLEDTLEKANDDCCDAILKFIVMDNDTKATLKDAKITLKLNGKVIFEGKTTDAEGEYLAKELCKGKYTVIIERDGYNRIETSWNVEKCDTFQEHFWMNKENDCCKGILRFKPKDKDGNILNGAKVYLYKDGKVIEDPVVKDGQAVIDGLCQGKYTIVYKREGYKVKEVQVELGCNQDKTLEEILEKVSEDCCKGIIRFKPKDKDGNILNGAKVYLYKDGKVIEDPVVKDGQAIIDGLCQGKYTIVYKREGYKDKEAQVELGCNQDKTLEEILEKVNDDCCDAILKFIVMDNDSKAALKDAKITLKLNGKVIFEGKTTDSEGEYLAKELCKGKYTVIIEKDGYNRIETSWNVEKCDTFQEHFWMNK